MDGFIRPLLERMSSSAFLQEAEAKNRKNRRQRKKARGKKPRKTPTPPPPPPPVVLRVRRSIFTLSMPEIQNLTTAFNAVKSAGIYDEFVRRHFDAMAVAHRGALFLPWHRKFIEELESALLRVNPSIEALPYWPFEQGSELLFTDDYFGPDGDPDEDHRVVSGPFATWRALIFNMQTGEMEPRSTEGLVRQLGAAGRLPTPSDVQNALGTSVYSSVRPALENAPVHDSVHLWIGGDMRASTSPNDPMFFPLHCNIDRLWWQWQLVNGVTNYQGPTGPMPFLQESSTADEVLDIQTLDYDYQ